MRNIDSFVGAWIEREDKFRYEVQRSSKVFHAKFCDRVVKGVNG